MGQDELAGGVGRLEAAVAAVERFHLVALEPVAEAAVEQGLGLGVDTLVVDGRGPGVLDVLHLEGQPAAVAGVVGEELEVVARGAERGHVGQPHLVAPVGRTLVDVERGGHGLQLVQLGTLHGVYLLEVHQQVLGHGEEVVLGEALRVGLRGVVAAQAGRQQVLQEGALERALRTEEDEDFVVHHAVVQRGGQQAHQPTAEVVVELGGRRAAAHHHPGQAADGVGHAVPGRQRVQVAAQGVVGGDEVALQQCAQAEEVGVQPLVLHGAPQGVLQRVGHQLPAGLLLPRPAREPHLQLVDEEVAAQLAPAADEGLHLPYRHAGHAPAARRSSINNRGTRPRIAREAAGGMLGGQGVAAAHGGRHGVLGGVVVGKLAEGPCLGIGLAHAEAVHPVEAAADVGVVAAGGVKDAVVLHQAAHGGGGAHGPHGPAPRGTGTHRCLQLHRQGLGLGAVAHGRVVAEGGHAGGVLALGIGGDARQAGVVVVHRLPGAGKGRGVGRHGRHAGHHPQAAAREGDVGQERVGIGADPCGQRVQAVGLHAVDVHHHEARVAAHVAAAAPALQGDGTDKGGQLASLDGCLAAFQFLGRGGVGLGFGPGQAGAGLAVEAGQGEVTSSTDFFHQCVPRGGHGHGVAQGGEARGLEGKGLFGCFHNMFLLKFATKLALSFLAVMYTWVHHF